MKTTAERRSINAERCAVQGTIAAAAILIGPDVARVGKTVQYSRRIDVRKLGLAIWAAILIAIFVLAGYESDLCRDQGGVYIRHQGCIVR